MPKPKKKGRKHDTWVLFLFLQVIERDAMRAPFPRFDLVVANIPYRISSPLVIKLVYGATPFRSATLLLQKEFARRLLTCPGDSGGFNRLSANVKLVADVELVMDVSKRDFLPSPKVDSSVVIIRPKPQIPNVDLHEWRAFTRTCFSSNRNKTLGALFKLKGKVFELFKISNGNDECSPHKGDEAQDERGLALFKEKIIGVVTSGGFEDKRPAKLSLQELLHLLSLFNQAGIYFNHRGRHKIEDTFDTDDE